MNQNEFQQYAVKHNGISNMTLHRYQTFSKKICYFFSSFSPVFQGKEGVRNISYLLYHSFIQNEHRISKYLKIFTIA